MRRSRKTTALMLRMAWTWLKGRGIDGIEPMAQTNYEEGIICGSKICLPILKSGIDKKYRKKFVKKSENADTIHTIGMSHKYG